MNIRKIGVVLLALLLAGMAMVPMVSAVEGTATDIREDEKAANDWQEKHKLKVTQTVISTYKDGVYETTTTYTGKGIKDRLGVDNFTTVKRIPLEIKEASTSLIFSRG